MTDEIRFEVTAYIDAAYSPTGEDYPLQLLPGEGSLTLGEDMDRDNFAEATLACHWLDDEVLELIDPREIETGAGNTGPIRVRVVEYERDGTGWAVRATLPDFPAAARLWPRTIVQDYVNRTTTITAASGELLLDDEIRISGTSTDTGATNVAELVVYAMDWVIGTYVLTQDPVCAATSLPAGPSRELNGGDSLLSLIKSELDGLNVRLYNPWGNTWIVQDRDYTEGAAVHLATAPDLQEDADPIVYELKETRTREGRWADGVLLKFDTTAYGGSVQYQAAGAGTSTKGVVITRTRPAPQGNAAEKLQTRTIIKGRDLDVTARARLDVTTRRTAAIWTRDTVAEGSIRAVQWRFPEGVMSLRVQS
jgi:hypothetical protein